LCQPLSVESSNYYGHLLALNDPSYIKNPSYYSSDPYFQSLSQFQHPSSSFLSEFQQSYYHLRGSSVGKGGQKISNSTFSQRERSTSAPNVYLVNQNQNCLEEFINKFQPHLSSGINSSHFLLFYKNLITSGLDFSWLNLVSIFLLA